MNRRWRVIGLAGAGVLLVGGGVASAATPNGDGSGSQTAIVRSVGHGVSRLAELVGIEDQVAPGTIDDGKELLPQAAITLDQAIAAAQATGPGELGEVDLEHDQGRLVFNVDMGDRDVKVDAQTGAILGAESDD